MHVLIRVCMYIGIYCYMHTVQFLETLFPACVSQYRMAKTQGIPYIAFLHLQIMHVSFFKSTTNYWADSRKAPSKVKPSHRSLPPCIREMFCVERGRFVFSFLFLDV